MIHTEFKSNILLAAEIYASRYGFAVIPVGENKRPLIKDWPKKATTDLSTIREWFSAHPNANLGSVTGAKSRIVVLDIDVKNEAPGMESLRALEKEFGTILETPTVLTPTGGLHFYFRYEGPPLKRRIGLKPGIDFLAEDSFAVLPPSIGSSGKLYTWEVSARIDEFEISPLPCWLKGLVLKNQGGDLSIQEQAHDVLFWRKLVTSGAREGERNSSTTQLAGHLLRHYVDPFVVLDLIQNWNLLRNSPPLSQEEVIGIVNSICRLERDRRGARIGQIHA